MNMPSFISRLDRVGNMPAMLSTNERINAQAIERIRNSAKAPNGYLVGAGFGGIFQLIDLFQKPDDMKGIICTDILPEVVLLGRAFIRNAKTYARMEDAVDNLSGLKSIPTYLAVINDEKNTKVKKRLISSIPYLLEWLEERPNLTHLKASESIPGSALKAIKKHYQTIRKLALESRIAINYASLSDQNWVDHLLNLPDWDSHRNVIYLSNVIDHASKRGTTFAETKKFDVALTNISSASSENWFAYTDELNFRYSLQLSESQPNFSEN